MGDGQMEQIDRTGRADGATQPVRVRVGTANGGRPRRSRPRRAEEASEETLAALAQLPHKGVRLSREDVEELLARAGTSAGLDLRSADLRRADLSDLDLSGARLEGARLQGARMIAANLQDAQLQDTHMEGAHLRGAILAGARLDHADLSGAHLEGAALQGAHLVRAHLAHAHLDGAHLRGARFDDATLWGTSLCAAELDGGHFSGADLNDANLDGAFFAGCMLADADLALLRWNRLRSGEELAARHAALVERPEQYRSAADAYRRLRQACAAQGLYDRAGEMYRQEMRMRQRALGFEALVALLRAPLLGVLARLLVMLALILAAPFVWLYRLLRTPLRPVLRPVGHVLAGIAAVGHAFARLLRPAVGWLWHAALEALCGYGERVGRVVIAAGIVVVGMALVYLRLGQLTEQDGTTVTSFFHALYFSACSFSSIGYATFAPNAHSLAKWLGVAESLCGNFLLALFLVTFTRKLTR